MSLTFLVRSARRRRSRITWAAAIGVLVGAAMGPAAAAEPAVEAGFDGEGLARLEVAGYPDGVLETGAFELERVQLASAYRNPNELDHRQQGKLPPAKDPYSGQHPAYTAGSTEVLAETFDAEAKRLTRQYPWGKVSITYRVDGNRLGLTLAIDNTAERAIEYLSFRPLLRLRLPGEVKGGGSHHNIGAPTVVPVEHGAGVVAVANEGVERPLRVKAAVAGRRAEVIVRSGYPAGGKEVYDGVWVTRPIAPGESDTYRLSLRFGGPDADKVALGRDVYRRYGETFPRTLSWPDRRPVGTVFLSSGRDQSEKNPRGWNFVPDEVDLATEAGEKAFRQGLMKRADRIIGQMHVKGLQGAIVWDLESATYETTHYFGAPRFLPVLAPLMNEHVDAFFEKLSAAGLRTGLTIRPLLFWPVDEDEKRVASWDAEKRAGVRHRNWLSFAETDHPQFERLGITPAEAQSPFLRLSRKIAYAKKRWGCSLFYVDTVYFWRPRDRSEEDGGWAAKQLPAEVFRKLNERHPDVLIIPEQQYPRFWAYTAPYHEIGYSPWRTTDAIRAMYPAGFVVQQIANNTDPVKKNPDFFARAVREGDALFTHGWWGGQARIVRKIYREATEEAAAVIELGADDGIALDGKPVESVRSLRKKLAAMAAGSSVVDRRTRIAYRAGTSADLRKRVMEAVREAGGILTWSVRVEP